MMSFERFKEKVVNEFLDYFPDAYANATVITKEVTKNNEVLTGLCLKSDATVSVTPVVYLEPAYREMQTTGISADKIIEDLENVRRPVKASGRISKDEYYLGIAEAVLQRSTCLRRKYGAVIVQYDVIVATGYNGSPRGMKNCCDTGLCEREKHNVPKGERYELCVAIHAEDNAISAAGRDKCLGSTLYICGMEMDGSYAKPDPCLMCNRKILNSGISKVIGRGKDGSVLEIPIIT